MSATEEAKRLVSSTILRVIRMQARAEALEAGLLRMADAGIKHPALAHALADSHGAVGHCGLLLGRLASLAVQCEQRAGNGLPN